MKFFDWLTMGSIGRPPTSTYVQGEPVYSPWEPKGPGRRLEPRVPITDPTFKYTPSYKTDLRTKFKRLMRKG